MLKACRFSVVVLLGAAVSLVAEQHYDTATARRIASAVARGQSLDYARELTAIGPRVSGTPGYEQAAQWAAEQFRHLGARVSIETFTIPQGWSRDARGEGRIVAPVERPISVESFGWAPPTPVEGVEADVLFAGQELTAAPERARGRIVIVNGNVRPEIDRRLKDAGALALLWADTDADNLIAARVRRFGAEMAPLPEGSIASDSVADIRELARSGAVRVRIAFRNRVSEGPVPLSNVIGELAGRDRTNEFVIVGAHLDSWDFATGAQDNATGVAMVLEAARAIAALGRPPRRAIRFALWGAEEQGLLGSAAYAGAHESELHNCAAVLNADAGTARIIGWTTPGRDDVMNRVKDLANALLADLQSTEVDKSMQYAYESDGGPFIRRGIPTLDLNADEGPYDAIHHKATDTFDRIDARNLATGAATVAVSAYAIADSSSRIAPHAPATR